MSNRDGYRVSVAFTGLWVGTVHGTSPSTPNPETGGLDLGPQCVDYVPAIRAFGLNADQAIRRAVAKAQRRHRPPRREVNVRPA